MIKKIEITALLITFYCQFVFGQKIQIVLIGTYHEPSLASQVFNAPVGDMLSTNQLADLDLLAGGLARWKPDYLLLALPQNQQTETMQKYKLFLNEPTAFQDDVLAQLAFRTAQKYTQTQILNIDTKEQIDFSGIISFAETNAQSAQLAHIQRLIQPILFSERQTFLQRNYFSFLEYLNTLAFANVLKKEFAHLPTIGNNENSIGATLAGAMMQKTAQWITAMHQLKSPQRVILFSNVKYLPALRYWLESNPNFEVLSWERVMKNKKKK